MNILEIALIFVIFCIVWIGTQAAWKIIEGRMLIKRQDELMDKTYAKLIRLSIRAAHDFKGLKEVIHRELD